MTTNELTPAARCAACFIACALLASHSYAAAVAALCLALVLSRVLASSTPREVELPTARFSPSPLASILSARPESVTEKRQLLAVGNKFCVATRALLSLEECEAIIRACEHDGFESLGAGFHPTYRNYTRRMYADAAAAVEIARRLARVLPEEYVDISERKWQLVGLNEGWRASKYVPGGQFEPHVDANFTRSLTERSFMTVIIYLNDVDASNQGGATIFPDPADRGTRLASLQPCAGDAIVFDHSMLHAGETLRSGLKYLLRSDVMYRLADEVDN